MIIRTQSWIISIALLLSFCCLGFIASHFAPVYSGLEPHIPVATRVAGQYGPLACPLLGVVAAVTLRLAHRFRWRRWVHWSLIVASGVLVVCLFYVLLFVPVSIASSIRTRSCVIDAHCARAVA